MYKIAAPGRTTDAGQLLQSIPLCVMGFAFRLAEFAVVLTLNNLSWPPGPARRHLRRRHRR